MTCDRSHPQFAIFPDESRSGLTSPASFRHDVRPHDDFDTPASPMHGRITVQGVGRGTTARTAMLFETANIRIQAEDQIATLWLDRAGHPTNTLSTELLDELVAGFDAVRARPTIDIVVVRSAKASGFGTGRDPVELAELESANDLAAYAERGQRAFDHLASLRGGLLTVALIDGPCLGASLELALACDYRLALARPTTELGFPDVRDGLVPCWGGTQRLPRLVGTHRSLQMLLSGEPISARLARRWGLVDHVFCERRARIELRSFLGALQDRPRKRHHRETNAVRRFFAVRGATRSLREVRADERPAPHRLVEAVRRGAGSFGEGLARERAFFAELGATDARRNAERLRSHLAAAPKFYPEPLNPVPPAPESVGVVGGGELGASLARWLALRGRKVVLQDANTQAVARADQRLEVLFRDAVERGWCTPLEAQQANQSIQRTVVWTGFERVGLAIEAVEDEAGVKRAVLHELEDQCRPRVPIVTTGASIRIESLQSELMRPGRAAGAHFAPPFGDTRLVELVRSPLTDSITLASLDAWLREWGRSPVMVTDRPGLVVLRGLLAYLSEAVLLVSEGLPPDVIDGAMRRFGMAEGPLEQLDRLGIDRVAEVVKGLQQACGERFARNLLLEPMRALGWTGRASGEGFYCYRGWRRKPSEVARMLVWRDTDDEVMAHYIFDPELSLREGVERMVLRAVNEAAACLGGEHPASVDAALVFGAAWAPHRGGPLRYADAIGVGNVASRLQQFAERFGSRFRPSGEIVRRAEAGESFHGTPVLAGARDSLRLVG